MPERTAQPSVSAVLPVHNGEAFVVEAIESVLGQSRAVAECIVIDDGSTDSTPEAVLGLGEAVTYIRQEQSGVSVARNHGARIACADLVAFLDHDDVWLPRKLECQVEALLANDATMALCGVTVVDAAGDVLATKRVSAREDLITGMLMFDGTQTVSCGSAGLIRRGALLAMGGFDAALSTSADWDLLLRVLLSGTLTVVDEPLVRYRVHDSNMTRSVSVTERDMRRAFAKAFADARLPEPLRRRKRRAYGRLYRMLSGSYRDAGDRRAALRTLATAVGHDPRVAVDLIRHRPTRS
jgi:glycosyltransferase involved in cell wall biosynthesis